ncbi:hypothetical protein EMIT013CA1_100127 [Bacillus sp. IT-13CA1]
MFDSENFFSEDICELLFFSFKFVRPLGFRFFDDDLLSHVSTPLKTSFYIIRYFDSERVDLKVGEVIKSKRLKFSMEDILDGLGSVEHHRNRRFCDQRSDRCNGRRV